MDQQKIGKFIAKMRKKKDLTQAELGEKVGVGDKAVSKWETGKGLPDTGLLFDLSEELGITVMDLLKGEILESEQEDKSTESREVKVTLGIDELNEFTKNGMELAKKEEKKKAKKKIFIAIIIIFLLLFSILGMYFYNNYNKVQIYRVESAHGEVKFDGILTINGNDSTLVMNNFIYNGKNVFEIYDMEYHFEINNESIFDYGDISSYDDNKIKKLNDYFKIINIYIKNINKSNIKNIINQEAILIIRYIDGDKKIYEYKVPIKLIKEYSNDKLIYIK